MNLQIDCQVKGDYQKVFEHFNENLFKKLTPSFIKIKKFDGVEVGDEFIIEIPILFTTMVWKGRISQREKSHDSCYFVDIGDTLPFPLKSWEHKHLILKDEENAIISDKINFDSYGGFFLRPFVYIMVYIMIKVRTPLYKSYFND